VQLFLIRHGLPVRKKTEDGSAADPPLSTLGRGQAEALGRWLADERIDALYTSPLRRARETAQPLEAGHGLDVRVEPGVTEFDAAADQYVPLEELKQQDYPAWKSLVSSGFYLEGDAETFRATVVAALERIIAAHAGARVAVVCHGGVINAWTSHLLGLERIFLFEPAYTSVSRYLAASSGERSLLSLNETAHLRGA
jgi:probable phosphoglycerate mutase